MCQRERAGQRCLMRGTHEALVPKRPSRLPFLPILRLFVGCFSGETKMLGAQLDRSAILVPLAGLAATISGVEESSREWLLCGRDCQQEGSTSTFAASRLTEGHGRWGEERWPHDD